MTFAFSYRYYVLEHFRGPEFKIPTTPEYARFHEWLAHMETVPAVRATLPDKTRYLQHVEKYANDKARSIVAEAVRAGKPAHEMAL